MLPRIVLPLCRLASRPAVWMSGVHTSPRVIASSVRGLPVLSSPVQHYCTDKPKAEVVHGEQPPGNANAAGSMPGFMPTDKEKWMLVFTGRYPSKADIPKEVSYDELTAAKDKMRVYVSTLLVILTFVSAFGVAMWGRSERDRGESLLKRNLQRRADKQKEMADQAAA
ncbi:protein FAM162A-like [Branchiostoma floridae x Branchiostoma japonicum]